MQIFGDNDEPHEWCITKENADAFLDSLDINVQYIDSFEFMTLVS